MASIIDRILETLLPNTVRLRQDVDVLTAQVRAIMVEQTEVDKKFKAMTDAIAGVRADIDDIKANTKPGEPMSQENFDKLSQIADALSALDAENPTA